MKQIISFLIFGLANLIPESYPYDARIFAAKAILASIVIGYVLSFGINHLINKLFSKFKDWLKEKRRNRRLASKKIPGTVFLGEVTQFLDKLKVAVIDIKNKHLQNGDYVFIYGKDTKLTFQVNSIQIDKNPVCIVKKGQEAGILVPKEVRHGDLIYKLKKRPKQPA